jgi:heterodisulfide reductase subunit C
MNPNKRYIVRVAFEVAPLERKVGVHVITSGSMVEAKREVKKDVEQFYSNVKIMYASRIHES